ncbi:MAG: hypothetical protein ACMG6E_09820 [Candidatus Roizmanbacteria bacterium]
MQSRALVVAIAFRCISEGLCAMVVGLELVVSVLGTHLQDYYHEGSHEEQPVGELLWLVGAVVEDLEVLVIGVLRFILFNGVVLNLYLEESCKLSRVPVDHCQIQGAEV